MQATMKKAMHILSTLLATLSTCAAHAAPCANEDFTTHVSGGGECLVIATFGLPAAERPNVLVVWLHGDQSDGGPPTSHVKPAQQVATQFAADRVLSIAMWRPGYSDAQGNASGGDNHNRTDSYTKTNMTIVGEAIARLKSHYSPARTVLVGHSGGAATAAVLLGMTPTLADAAVLVSCPCDLRAWRTGRRWWPNSEDPLAWAAKVPSSDKVIALTGTADDNTSPQLAQTYLAALTAHQIDARFVPIADATHNSALRAPEVIEAVGSVMK